MKTWIKVSVISLILVLLALLFWWFQPWRLVTKSEISEPLSSAQSVSGEVTAEGPTQLYTGTFISHEHQTVGAAKVVELADGSRILRLEGFETSDGPDLEVWLAEAPVITGYDGWFVADDQRYVSLGKLKGTSGEQNYEIPQGLDLDVYSSAVIWCARFAVSFGAAELISAN